MQPIQPDGKEPSPPISLREIHPEAYAKALSDAKEHTPLFRLGFTLHTLPQRAAVVFQKDVGRSFPESHTIKLVARAPEAGCDASHVISLTLVDIGTTVTSVECLICDGVRLPCTSGSVSIETQKTGECPVFHTSYGWTPVAAPTKKGERDLLPLELHYKHGPIDSILRVHLQVKFYDGERPERATKACTGDELRSAECKYDASQPGKLVWHYEGATS
ncbi:MAG: hypothetical protein SGPRY_005012 [Prymnesium sp.]